MVNNQPQLDHVFLALSDPTRRQMLARLATGSMSVAELSEPFGISKPAVTKHLKMLERAGLMKRQVEGRVHRCTLNAEPLSAVSEWVHHYEAFWQGKLDRLDAFLSASKPKP